MRSMVEGKPLAAPKREDVVNARQLRRAMSPPEALLWRTLRTRPEGLKFRRQHPLGDYKLDFFCREAGVAVEVDGDSHDMGNRPQRDEFRDVRLAEHGIVTVRLLAAEVMRNTEGVVQHIVALCLPRRP